MTATSATAAKTPWHLWVVGLFGVLWNGMACFDYVMTNISGADHLRSAGMSEAVIAYVTGYPAWMTVVWAIAVWGGLAGAVLLLLRRKWALHSFAASLAAFAIYLGYMFTPLGGAAAEAVRSDYAVWNAGILALCVFFVCYAWF